MKPTVGRIVHYWFNNEQKQPCAAIVTYVHGDDCVNLFILPHHVAGQQLLITSAVRAVEPLAGFWNWPPRE